jgi:hypothetical protein
MSITSTFRHEKKRPSRGVWYRWRRLARAAKAINQA